ncbi:MAG: DUF1178 family protein [Cypionkella sp.]|uniref:DUF1178 family protein n=1 Tax=Cypionkella sp. TaxID=2811411 RepID=UPI002AB998B7|nr:DUF1178 family protein [Cypionkella sp.]MDZ4312585.1 DUF1178 family protein [Cypionkella sp.]MDZ4393215.1 DUF1178 family protein [Cypionkella sp.]
MISYSLRCSNSHGFDSWFQSAGAYESLLTAGRISCPICGDTAIDKALMAPAVRPARKAGEPAAKPKLSEPTSELESALAELRRQVEANSEYVGMNFAAEARRMHDGEIDQRAIYGEAKPAEARALIEDGVPVAPLPFMPPRKAN